MDSNERQRELASFLRTRRERLTPAEAGLPSGVRRRTPGLRREEVSQLANIGMSWYTALEQARNVRPSEQVLESLALALRLTPDERRHLFLLALQHDPAPTDQHSEAVTPPMEQLVQALDPNPGYLMGRRWDVLTFNRAAEFVMNFSTWPPPYDRNFVWRLFSYRGTPQRDWDYWKVFARTIVAQFRADSARYPGDPAFEELITDLQRSSDDFRYFWSQYDVRDTPAWHVKMTHATLGRLEFEHLALQPIGNHDLRLVTYLPDPPTAAKLHAALGRTRSAVAPSALSH